MAARKTAARSPAPRCGTEATKVKAKTKTKTKAKTKTRAKAQPKARGKSAARTSSTPSPTAPQRSPTAAVGGASSLAASCGIRVRMYRVGFGDFFLLTVPGNDGPAHILIDCGVHAANIGSIGRVREGPEEGDRQPPRARDPHPLSRRPHVGLRVELRRLRAISTMSARCGSPTASIRRQSRRLQVHGADSPPWRTQLRLQLGARRRSRRPSRRSARCDNALGVTLGASGRRREQRQGAEAAAIRVQEQAAGLLLSGRRHADAAGGAAGQDHRRDPGPSPKDSGGEFSASDNKKEQYLAAVGDGGIARRRARAAVREGVAGERRRLSAEAFDEFDSGLVGRAARASATARGAWRRPSRPCSPTCWPPPPTSWMARSTTRASSCSSPARARSCCSSATRNGATGPTGSTARPLPGADPGITDARQDILGSIDFYKVGHHGSTNATPIPAVGALSQHASAMCSTATGAYG